jgi:phosphate-selective porin OprO/OprP
LFAQPFLKTDIEPLRKLGFGAGGSIGNHAGALTSYKTAGQQTFFSYAAADTANGRQYRLDPQAYYYWGPFGVLGEYALSSQKVQSTSTTPGVAHLARFNNRAWQVEASYFLTGEENSFKYTSRQHVVPLHRLFDGGWGAFEVVGRVQQLSLDKQAFPNYAAAGSARVATAWGAGLNWYLNENVKLNLNYESTSFRGGLSPNAITAKQEHIIFSRIQFQF